MSANNRAELRLPMIGFDMPITDLILELEKLREKDVKGSTPEFIFLQIKDIFHMMESIGSARIEGNNTTVMDYVDQEKIDSHHGSNNRSEDIAEIHNIEHAMIYIEQYLKDTHIDKRFLRELHELVVKKLSANREGARIAGGFREHAVRITGSTHRPPEHYEIDPLLDELMVFVNEQSSPKYDLLRIALAHHRLVWIHPFENGNGRVVRLFTYALLIKFIFKNTARIINPTAVFCSDRAEYYRYLAEADKGTDEGYIEWCMYMLRGLKVEIEKIEKLSEYDYLKNKILLPALSDARDRQYVTTEELIILKTAIEQQEIKAADLKAALSGKTASQLSRLIRGLTEKKMLRRRSEKGRIYAINISNNVLMRCVVVQLDKGGFLPVKAS